MVIGERITELRKALGFTQQELADALGVSQSAVCFWERGDDLPAFERLGDIARVLKTPYRALERLYLAARRAA